MSLEEKKTETSENAFANVEDFETNAVVNIDQNKKDIGIFSAVFLVTNRIIGAGVFSTASTILTLSGSVGTSMILWVVGSIIAFTGLLTYMEL
ncbi:hypothetical protein OXX69_012231, partial [Metschnikowia pulcherrima]